MRARAGRCKIFAVFGFEGVTGITLEGGEGHTTGWSQE